MPNDDIPNYLAMYTGGELFPNGSPTPPKPPQVYTKDELELLHRLLTYRGINAVVHKREFITFSAIHGLTNEQLKSFVSDLIVKVENDIKSK